MSRPEVGYAYLGDGVGLTYTHRGHKLLVYTRDLGLTPHLVLSGEWERAIEDAVLRQTPVGGTVVEVGCNMGYHTLAMSEKLGPSGKLYGFEANPNVYRLLRWTLDLNAYLGIATLYNHAVTQVPGDVEFGFTPEAVGGGHIITGSSAASDRLRVKGEPLDITLAHVPHIDLLRMDAEGFEPPIVRGAQQLLDRSPNATIICEWAPLMMRDKVDLPEYCREMEEKGYSSWKILSDSSFSKVSSSELPNLDHCEIVFSKQEPK